MPKRKHEREVDKAAKKVANYVSDVECNQLITALKQTGALRSRFDATSVGYEKVQLFRVMLALDPDALGGNEVFTKFVNETYHIENEYVMQLNPREFDAVPDFVAMACAELVDAARAAQV